MQIGSRFTEYGLTGGFFWICQLILLWYSGQTQALLSNLSTVQKLQVSTEISQIGSTAITSLVGALAIITVFLAGLLLDLLAEYLFRPMEMRVFHRHLVRNRDWLGRLIADHKGYCEPDYEQLERGFGEGSLVKDRLGLDIFLFWNRDRRQRYFAAVKRNLGWGLARPYERLWSFLASYVIILSGSSELSLMVDQYYLWRTGRAVSVVLYIVFLEVLFLILLPGLLLSSSHASVLTLLLGSFSQLCVSFLVSLLATGITLGTYSRLCFTLFALVYVTDDKRTMEVRNGA